MELDPTTIGLYGLGIPVLVTTAVQIMKHLGLPDAGAPWAAFGSTALFVALAQLLKAFPSLDPLVYGVVMLVFLAGGYFAATGIYTTTKNVLTHTGLVQEKPEAGASNGR